MLEDALDIQERHFRLHWILNYAQLTTSLTFQGMVKGMLGEQHAALVDSILTSDRDRNWDSVRDLWKFKERVKRNATLRAAFDQNPSAAGVMNALKSSDAGRALLKGEAIIRDRQDLISVDSSSARRMLEMGITAWAWQSATTTTTDTLICL